MKVPSYLLYRKLVDLLLVQGSFFMVWNWPLNSVKENLISVEYNDFFVCALVLW